MAQSEKIFGTIKDEKNAYILGIDPGARNLGYAFLNLATGKIDECGVMELIDKGQMTDVNKNGEKNDTMHAAAISAAKFSMYSNKWAHIFSNPKQIIMVAIEDQFVSTSLVQALTHALIFHFTPRVSVLNANAVKTHYNCKNDNDNKDLTIAAAILQMTTSQSDEALKHFSEIAHKRQQHAADAILLAYHFYTSKVSK
jgi:Holliday junction resolvasome RuvABC endonuclease subunit